MTAAVGLDPGFDLPGLLLHGGKPGALGLVKAVVADAQDPEVPFQQGTTWPKFPFQWQQVPGSSKSAGAVGLPNS